MILHASTLKDGFVFHLQGDRYSSKYGLRHEVYNTSFSQTTEDRNVDPSQKIDPNVLSVFV